jgi:hypothetical protein
LAEFIDQKASVNLHMSQSSFPPPNQSQSESPFGQQQFPQYNFGQPGIPGMPYGFPEPKRRSGLRTCLIIFGVIFGCIAIVCVCAGVVAYQARETFPPIMWAAFAGQENLLQDAVDMGLVCKGSQAESFTQRFLRAYPGKVQIQVTGNTTESVGTAKQVRLTGTLTYNGLSRSYEAIFTISDQQKFFVLFNCISNIQQLSPSLS